MHEAGVVRDLIRKVERVARENNASRIVGVSVSLGALSHLSADHFRAHYAIAAAGTPAQHARLEIDERTDTSDPLAQAIILRHVDVETAE